jgi:hypothetical protein
MSKTQINYQNTVIYKIVCNDTSIRDMYIGSTSNFNRRKYEHKSICYNKNSLKTNELKYIVIRNNGGWENWKMIEIEKYPCSDVNEARARERFWYDNLDKSLNTYRPQATKEENKEKYKKYRNKNIDKIKDYKKMYREINKDKIKEYNKIYHQTKKHINN